tara:strand:- start:14 stop:799 length:786 start_codon:yes stop_codon:yes gene_type:complete
VEEKIMAWEWIPDKSELKRFFGITSGARNLGEGITYAFGGKPAQFYHRFLETPIGKQDEARITEADYDPHHLDFLRDMAIVAMEDGRYHTSPKDYLEVLRREKARTSIKWDLHHPYQRAAKTMVHTLGGFEFDIKDGNVYVKDKYDFNQHKLSPQMESQWGLTPDTSEGTPYTRQQLSDFVEKVGYGTERGFPWWGAVRDRFLSAFPSGKDNPNPAFLGRLYSPPFEQGTSLPVEVNLGSVSDVYGPMHYKNRPTGGIIGR